MIRVVSCTVLDAVTLVEVEWVPSWVDCVAIPIMALIDVPLNTKTDIIDREVIGVGDTDLFRVERVTMVVGRGEQFFVCVEWSNTHEPLENVPPAAMDAFFQSHFVANVTRTGTAYDMG